MSDFNGLIVGAKPSHLGAEHFPAPRTIEKPASLRSERVRDHSGMLFGFIPDSAFGFAGILNTHSTATKRTFTY